MRLEEAEKNGKIRVLSTSARDVVEEYLTVNQHLSRQVEGRLVVEDRRMWRSIRSSWVPVTLSIYTASS